MWLANVLIRHFTRCLAVVVPFFEISGLTTVRSQAELERSNRLQYTDLEQKLQRQFADDEDVGMDRFGFLTAASIPLLIGLFCSCNLPVNTAKEYCGIINDCLLMDKNVIVCRNFSSGSRGKKGRLYTHTRYGLGWFMTTRVAASVPSCSRV
jgi:hypothetical protein